MPISIVPMTKEEIKKNQKRFPKTKKSGALGKAKKARRAAPMAKPSPKGFPLKRKGGGMTKKTKYMKKGGAMKKTKYMKKGGAMKKTKYMSKGGAMKKTKYMSKGGKLTGMARRRNARRG